MLDQGLISNPKQPRLTRNQVNVQAWVAQEAKKARVLEVVDLGPFQPEKVEIVEGTITSWSVQELCRENGVRGSRGLIRTWRA